MLTALLEFRIEKSISKAPPKEKGERLAETRLNDFLRGKLKSVKRALATSEARDAARREEERRMAESSA